MLLKGPLTRMRVNLPLLESYRQSKSRELGHNAWSDEELRQVEAFLRSSGGPIVMPVSHQ